jgi:hypothetical protein
VLLKMILIPNICSVSVISLQIMSIYTNWYNLILLVKAQQLINGTQKTVPFTKKMKDLWSDIYGFSVATQLGVHWQCIPPSVRAHFKVNLHQLVPTNIIRIIMPISHCTAKTVYLLISPSFSLIIRCYLMRLISI